MEENKKHAMHIAALVLGIISIITNWFWYMSIPTGILAIIFGVKSAKKFGSKIGKAGLITGIIGLSLCIFAYTGMAIILFLANM